MLAAYEEGDGRYVRAPGPSLNRLREEWSYFTAKSSFQGLVSCPFSSCSMLENVAHFFHPIGYTLTCLVSGGLLSSLLVFHLGGLATAVCRLFGQGVVGWIVDYRL